MRRRVKTISVNLSLFVYLNFMNKLKFNVKKLNNTLTVQIFYNVQNHQTFNSEERLVNLANGRVYTLFFYTYIISLWFDPSWDRTPDPVSAAVSLEKAIYLSPCLGAGCEFLALFIFSGSWQGSCITN